MKRTVSLLHQPLPSLCIGAIGLLGTYGLGSLAINSGSLLQYALALVLVAVGFHFLGQAIRSVVHGRK